MDHTEAELNHSRRILPYLLCGILLLVYRLWVNFSHELLPGINGGYYPLQIRSVLENGRPGFNDMPLLFYLNAFLVKVFFLFSDQEFGAIILFTSKLTDSLSLPLLLIPLYQIRRDRAGESLKWSEELVVASLASLSLFPLMLVSEVQKNALAIPMLAFFLLLFLRFLRKPSLRSAVLPVLFLLLTGLTHFGVFSITLSLLLIGIVVFFRKRSLIFVFPLAAAGIGLVWILDPERADSVLWLAFTLFRDHVLRGAPVHLSVILYLITGWILTGAGLLLLLKKSGDLPSFHRKVIIMLVAASAIFAIPFMGQEYLLRFSLILFFPHSVLLLLLLTHLKTDGRRLVVICTAVLVLFSITASLAGSRRPVLSGEAVKDLYELKSRISDSGNCLVIARHGLEWWAGWILETSIGQEKALDEETFGKYDRVIILVQKKVPPSRKMTHHRFPEPRYPPDAAPLYESDQILAVELRKDQFLRRPGPSSRPPRQISFSRKHSRSP